MGRSSGGSSALTTLWRTVAAVTVAAGTILATTTTAGGSGSEVVTYSAIVTSPAPPASNFAGSAGGDGWAVAVGTNQVFNIFHHQLTLQVACHNQADASACWAPKTITDGSGNNFASAGQPGLYLDPTTQHLFVFATRTNDNTGGVVCIDTTQAANPDPFCGFTPLTAVGQADGVSWSHISDPVIYGDDWYAFNFVNTAAAPVGTEDTLMCFDLSTLSACSTPNINVNIGSPGALTNPFPAPSIAVVGGQIVIPIEGSGSTPLFACWDAQTSSNCSGSWPATAPSIGTYGAPFPMTDSLGNFTGFCLPNGTDPCFNLAGGSVATPPNMTTAIGANVVWDGPAFVLGPRAYVPNGNTDDVDCYDYDLQASCANFPLHLNNLGLLYTVNADPQRPTCIWVNSDDGTDQIQNFDAYTAGACGKGAVRVLTSAVVPGGSACVPSQWTSLQVLEPPPGGYTTGTVSFADVDGNPIPGLPTLTLDSTGTADLTPLDFTSTGNLPQFVINLSGLSSNVSSVQVKLTWMGPDNPACGEAVSVTNYLLAGRDGGVFAYPNFQGSLPPPSQGLLVDNIAGIASANDGKSYWLAGKDGGVYAFGTAQYYGSLPGLGISVDNIVGIAATPDGLGYWLVGADGAVYAFGDAPFAGSVPGLGLSVNNIVGIAATPSGHGYWLAGKDGGLFTFGDAPFAGSLPSLGIHVNDVVGIAEPDAGGYWLAGGNCAVYAFGDAQYRGSLPGLGIAVNDVVGIASPDAGGYWLTGADGAVFALGDAPYLGSMGGLYLYRPIVGIT